MTASRAVTRLIALTRKETRQMLRDGSNLVVGICLPVVMILLFGYGLSFDVTDARVAVVMEDNSAATVNAVAGLVGSEYLSPIWTHSMDEAEHLVRAGDADAILRVPADFTRNLTGGGGQLQLDHGDVRGHAFQRLHARRQLADLDVAGQADLGGLDHHVGSRTGLAEQRVAVGQFFGRQDLRRILPGIELPGNHAALAGGARAVATAIRQDDARGQGGIEHGLAGLDRELMLAGLDDDLEAHDETVQGFGGPPLAKRSARPGLRPGTCGFP